MIFKIVLYILPLLTLAYWVRLFVIHRKLKAYFWRFMPEDDKAVINYIWHRSVLAAERKMCIAHWWLCLLIPVEFIIIVCRLAWNTH